ncbi:hypothetical protein OH76DRAFT_833216 [Lentinus brumalis]|uniref:Uncharacterized protein n=1 Tax=Lentinus brumalis TaxID=2498619 RepID=A0A371D1Y4_9APHY|nr:hypothetical protein OH76DRAFT_833216 [Polyporus brumalis]
MSDYFAVSPVSVAGHASHSPSAPSSGTPQALPLRKDAPFRAPVLGLAIHLVQTPHGSMNEQQAALRIKDMELMAQELEMALAAKDVPEIILIKDDEPCARDLVSAKRQPETSPLPTTRDVPNEPERETIIAPTFSSLFCGPRSSPSSTITAPVPASDASSASFLNFSPSDDYVPPSEIICTLPPNTAFGVPSSEVVVTNAAPTSMPWFSPSYDPCSTSPITTSMMCRPPSSAYHPPPSLTYAADIEMEEFDIVIISPTIPHQAEQLEESSAVIPPITLTSSATTPSYSSFGDGRLQPSAACADFAELLLFNNEDDEDGSVVVSGDGDSRSDGVDAVNSNERPPDRSRVMRQDREQPLPSPVQAAATTSAAPLAPPLIATASSCDMLLAQPSPPVELSSTGITHSPIFAYTLVSPRETNDATTFGDQRLDKERQAVYRPPSRMSTWTKFIKKKAHMEHNPSHPTSSYVPVSPSTSASPARYLSRKPATLPKRPSSPATRTSIRPTPHISKPSTSTAGQSQLLKRKRNDGDEKHSTSAPPTRNLPMKFATLPKRPSPVATRAPRTSTRPTPHISTHSTTPSTGGQLKRKRNDDDDEEHGEPSTSGAPTGRPSNKIARETPPASKKPKPLCATPTASAPTTGHFRSAADLAHKRWEERMQQQAGGRMRVVSTDHLAMRAKVRRPRASNVGR